MSTLTILNSFEESAALQMLKKDARKKCDSQIRGISRIPFVSVQIHRIVRVSGMYPTWVFQRDVEMQSVEEYND